MPIIETDDPAIETELKTLTKLIAEGGGGIHSNMLISCHDGNLQVTTKEPMDTGKELIRLSKQMLLPSNQFSVIGNNFTPVGSEYNKIFPDKCTLSPLQQKLAESMSSLYNLTDKVALHKKFSFQMNIAPYPHLMDKLEEARSINDEMKKTRKKLEKGLKGKELDEYVIESYMHTRHLGYNDTELFRSTPMLMPVIDFFNHHWNGARYNVSQNIRKGDLAVKNSQPAPDSNECYAFYGIMDSLDSLIRYDFIDEHAPIIRSIPIELDAPNGRKIVIESSMSGMHQGKLNKNIADLERYMPIITNNNEDRTLKASHLLIPTDASQLALRRVLVHILTQTGEEIPDEKELKIWVRNAEEEIIEKNSTYYTEFLKSVEKAIKEKGKDGILQQLQHVCQLQLSKLALYKPKG